MVDIKKVCYDFYNVLENKTSSEQVLEQCVVKKLNSLYQKQSDDYDELIETIDKLIDTDNIPAMCKVVNKLSKNMNSNRKQLILLIERLEGD